jgi:PAS domain S-box-containing protein
METKDKIKISIFGTVDQNLENFDYLLKNQNFEILNIFVNNPSDAINNLCKDSNISIFNEEEFFEKSEELVNQKINFVFLFSEISIENRAKIPSDLHLIDRDTFEILKNCYFSQESKDEKTDKDLDSTEEKIENENIQSQNTDEIKEQYSHLLKEEEEKSEEIKKEISLFKDTSKAFSGVFDKNNITSFIHDIIKKKIKFNISGLLQFEPKNHSHLIVTADTDITDKLKDEFSIRIFEKFLAVSKLEGNSNNLITIFNKSITPTLSDTIIENPTEDKIIQSFIGIPLIIMEKSIGMFAIAFYEKYNLSADEKEFLDIISTQITYFLEYDSVKQNMITEKNVLISMLQSMSEGVLFYDENGFIKQINSLAGSFLGIDYLQANEQNIKDIINNSQILEILEKNSENQENFSQELELTNSMDGITRNIFITISKIKDFLQKNVGTLVILRDITKEKSVDKMKSDFISVASHEIRNPLNAIKQSVDIINNPASGELTKDQKELLEMAQKNIDKLLQLSNDLLDTSKIESGKLELTKKESNINEIVEQTSQNFDAQLKNAKINFKTNLQDSLPLANIDPLRISQVITNLISNAIKFSKENGTITISSFNNKDDSNMIQISVADTGEGMSKEDIPKLFQKFQQVGTSAEKKFKGTGLGLALCKNIIDLHGGKIWVDSEIEKGSTFNFTLPIK